MFLSAAIDSGIGLTAEKKLCGKAVAQSDDTYLTTVNLRQKFLQMKNFLNIREQPKTKIEDIEALKSAIIKLQEELTQQKTVVGVISEENVNIKKQITERGKEIAAMQEGMARIALVVEAFSGLSSEELKKFFEPFGTTKDRIDDVKRKDVGNSMVYQQFLKPDVSLEDEAEAKKTRAKKPQE